MNVPYFKAEGATAVVAQKMCYEGGVVLLLENKCILLLKTTDILASACFTTKNGQNDSLTGSCGSYKAGYT